MPADRALHIVPLALTREAVVACEAVRTCGQAAMDSRFAPPSFALRSLFGRHRPVAGVWSGRRS